MCLYRMKSTLIYLFFLIPLLLSCDDDNVRLRLENDSTIDFNAVFVAASGPEVAFGPLVSGEVSDYEVFDVLYRYAYVRIVVNDIEYVLQPIDYVGESPLTSGDYTYRLNIADPDDPWSVTLEFIRE